MRLSSWKKEGITGGSKWYDDFVVSELTHTHTYTTVVVVVSSWPTEYVSVWYDYVQCSQVRNQAGIGVTSFMCLPTSHHLSFAYLGTPSWPIQLILVSGQYRDRVKYH